MEMADDALFSKYDKEQMIGEAKFIRAYTYFELVKTFGGVPCYTGVLDLDHRDSDVRLSKRYIGYRARPKRCG